MIKIFDTTLRDGEQSPGFAMNIQQKLLLAKQLERLGVDVIEAGFPQASPEDFKSVKLIAETCRDVEVCALARCHEKDIEAAIKALKGAVKPRIHVFIGASDIHLKHKLKISRREALSKAVMGVKKARAFTSRVDFSPEDGTRADREFLIDILSAVIDAGVDTINIPDTVGYMTPDEYGELIGFLRKNVSGIERVIISTHCHNDLGLAVANSLSGVLHGARQIECTINGIGERAGNASLEEIVMILKTRKDIYQAQVNIDTTQLLATSRLLAQVTGQKVQPNKAIVGKNAFAHGAGIHQHGMLSERSTYEIMKPEDIGFSSTHIFLSKHSGRHGLMHRLNELGINLEMERLDQVFVKFKALADKKKNIYDEDLILLLGEGEYRRKFEFLSLRVMSVANQSAQVQFCFRMGDEQIQAMTKDNGPVSAIYNAMASQVGLSGMLTEFNIHACTPEQEAIGMVCIAWREGDGIEWQGHGADTDILLASGYAFIDMLNNRELRLSRPRPPYPVALSRRGGAVRG